MSRIKDAFDKLKPTAQKAFIPYLTVGYPDVKTTEQLVLMLAAEPGVTLIELGVPFSDPLADGPTIQMASQYALDQGVTLEATFELVKRIRQKSDVPLALMMYYNQIFHYGEDAFIKKVAEVGVNGLIIPDLPPEEAQNLIHSAREYDVDTVFFIAPTTSDKRLPTIISSTSGFLYCVSITGVTGTRNTIPEEVFQVIQRTRVQSDIPICMGFGISKPDHIYQAAAHVDGVIVGSAIIKTIATHQFNPDQAIIAVRDYVRDMLEATRHPVKG